MVRFSLKNDDFSIYGREQYAIVLYGVSKTNHKKLRWQVSSCLMKRRV